MLKPALLLMGLLAAATQASVKIQTVEYRQDTASLSGLLAYETGAAKAKKPGIVLFSDWMGVSDFARVQAEKVARLGYVVFVADVYGKGHQPKDQKEAGALSSIYKGDRALTRARAAAALDQLRKAAGVDTSKLAAMGYCFGGMVALELSRSGAPLLGTAVFHGTLDTPDPSQAKNIKGSVAVFHGADDPFVNADQVRGFMDEMKKAGVDWRFTYYSGAVHAFTNPQAGNDPSKGAAYNAKADARSWESMKLYYQEIFGPAAR